METVSILIPCFNVEQFLRKCVESICSQTYNSIQIVMIDDGSTDNTWQVMQKLVSSDTRIEIYHQENKGVAATRNALLSRIKGEYALFVDADDWIEPNMVEFLLDKINVHKADVAICGMVKNDIIVSSDYKENLLDRSETVEKFLLHNELRGSLWNKLVKTSLFHNLSFDSSISYGEDALFCWQIFEKVDKVVLTDRQLYHYRMNDSSISHSKFGKQKLTGNEVWRKITEDVELSWPIYSEISKGRWGMENYYLLMQASSGDYPKTEEIRNLQSNIRKHYSSMKSTGLLQGKDVLNAYIISHWYCYGKAYTCLHNIKDLFRC
ncbi:MAG: glycosyltransferase [Muribaculum sp.]|nr:glycosyltransferase [Muribaculum sp.]